MDKVSGSAVGSPTRIPSSPATVRDASPKPTEEAKSPTKTEEAKSPTKTEGATSPTKTEEAKSPVKTGNPVTDKPPAAATEGDQEENRVA